MQFTRKEHKKFSKKNYNSFILGCDIGGTNTKIGIFGIKNKNPKLLSQFDFKTKELKDLSSAVSQVLSFAEKNYKIKITNACIAIAGVISHKKDFARMTNASLIVRTNDLAKKSKLKKILLINDFEAVGYGINMLQKKDIKTIKRGKNVEKAPIAVVGAGTGLGKATLIYNEHYKFYVPISSEAGHTDFPAQTQEEFELIDFIKRNKKLKMVSYEEILSGRGLVAIYSFLKNIKKFSDTKFTKEIEKKLSPESISKYRKTDKTSKAAFNVFKKAYAKFARNCALDAMAFCGVCIAGGIAPRNKDLFDKDFIKEFEKSGKMRGVLKKIPVYLVLNLNVGLLGAGLAGAKIK